MWKTFHLTPTHDIKIASKLWSDFSATLPLIRSFSYGANLPPEYAIFAGPPIRYHFGFFLLVGFLEKAGTPLDWALNIPSSLGFFFLLAMIYLVGKHVFKSKILGIISVILTLFNGSFAFLEFFKKYPLSANTFNDIVKNTTFAAFGPFDGSIVSAFWNLNIYTNQRHLAASYGFLLFLILFIYHNSQNPKKFTINKVVFLGLMIGFFPFLHMATFGMMGITLLMYLLIFTNLRKKVLIAGIVAFCVALPQIIYMGPSQVEINLIKPGYLVENLSFINFVKYWFLNLGLVTILAPLGFIIADSEKRKLFLPFLFFFVIGNVFQFTPSMIDNHKFFNIFAISANLFSAFLILNVWKKIVWARIFVLPVFLIITISGIIDFFPILNDRYIVIEDVPKNKTASFILNHTPPNSVFLNAEYIFDDASIAGRKTYLGWPYFPWSLGYDVDTRLENLQKVLNSTDKTFICNFLKSQGVNYIEVKRPPTIERVNTDYDFFNNNFIEIYRKDNQLVIYDLDKSCGSDYL